MNLHAKGEGNQSGNRKGDCIVQQLRVTWGDNATGDQTMETRWKGKSRDRSDDAKKDEDSLRKTRRTRHDEGQAALLPIGHCVSRYRATE
jgi:hypothetical protein